LVALLGTLAKMRVCGRQSLARPFGLAQGWLSAC